MIRTLTSTPPTILTLGARGHGQLLASHAEASRKALTDGDWTCHICKIRIPEMMEIDNSLGHSRANSGKGLKPICQFCHNVKHPLWAASKKRFVAIFAPDMLQADLHRLAWTVVAHRDVVAMDEIDDAIRMRIDKASSLIGCDNMESFFESCLLLMRQHGVDAAGKVFLELDQYIRLWPTEALPDAEDNPSASRLSVWTIGGFRQAARTAIRKMNDAHEIDVESVAAAGARTLSDMAGEAPSPASDDEDVSDPDDLDDIDFDIDNDSVADGSIDDLIAQEENNKA